MSTPIPRSDPQDVVALSVHGPAGVLDFHVPVGASGADVAAEYSRQASLPTVPRLYTRMGRPLSADVSLADAGIGAGAVLVAAEASPGEASRSRRSGEAGRRVVVPGPLSGLWFSLAVAIAALAGGYAASLAASTERDVTIATLIAAAVLGCLPWGPWAAHRVLAAPAFAAAAAFAIAWDPADARLPTIIGIAALAAAICAAVARALDEHAEEGLRVWGIVGALLFVVTTAAALASIEAQVVWALLLLAAMLAARFVPQLAVDVPDHYLLDLERLAVTAWSARERPRGRRGRIVVPRPYVIAVAQRGARLVTAAAVAIMVVAAVSAALLLRETTASVDVIGARCEVGFCGGALLLAARSYRHVGARAALRAAGLACWLVLAVVAFDAAGQGLATSIAVGAVVLGAVVVLVAVALGRGWRSAWWARRAEVAESFCAAFGVGSVVVAAGLVTALWN
ncbi:hypothetical protein BH09ACT12_BH09ACT12_05260 [soil metagenome]